MKNFLDISFYTDGIPAFYLNCIDIPIATVSGGYNHDNYFYYAFNYIALHNWSDIDTTDWLAVRTRILDKLGLAMKCHVLKDVSELMPTIKTSIDNRKPLLMPTKYEALFYHYAIGVSESSHFILIRGYDTERSRVCIRELSHIDESGYRHNMDYSVGLYNLYLTEDILEGIWTKSDILFAGSEPDYNPFYSFDNEFSKKLYYMEEAGKPQINSYPDMVRDFLDGFSPDNSRLIRLINNSDSLYDEVNNNTRALKHAFHFGAIILFKVLERAFDFLKTDTGAQQAFYEFRDRYVDFRNTLVLKLTADALREEVYSEDEKSRITGEIHAVDNELFSLVKALYEKGR